VFCAGKGAAFVEEVLTGGVSECDLMEFCLTSSWRTARRAS